MLHDTTTPQQEVVAVDYEAVVEVNTLRAGGTISAAHKCHASEGSSRRRACKEVVNAMGLNQGPAGPDAEREAKQEQACPERRHGGERLSCKPSSNDSHDETRHHQSSRDTRLLDWVNCHAASSRCSQKSTGARSL
jgi:hypothetical protein